VLRKAATLAGQLGASWEAVHVATPTTSHVPPVRREALLKAFRLAEDLGGQTNTLNGDDPASEILAYAQRSGASHIVVGASAYPGWLQALFGSVSARLVRGAGDLAIEVCAREQKAPGEVIKDALRPPPFGDVTGYLISAGFVALVTLLAISVHSILSLPNISLVFVLAVIAAAVRYGAWASAFAALLSALAINFFLTPPLYSFAIADPNDVWAILFFLVVGIAVSSVAAHARAQTLIARRQASESAQLRAFAREIVGAEGETEIAASTAETASRMLYARAVVLTPTHGQLEAIAEAPGPEMLGADDIAAAQWSFEQGREAGHGSGALDSARWLFVPTPGESGPVGIVGVRTFDDASRLDPEQRRLLDLIAAQAGVAMDRARLGRIAANARVDAEGERQKRVLIASLSHDLRTPLTTVRGNIESLLKYGDKHDAVTRQALLSDAAAESLKLSGFLQNMLDMMRLDTGAVHAKREAADIADVAEAAIDRAFPALEGKHVARDIASGLPALRLDRAMTEDALVKILENAGKYSPRHSTVLVRVRREHDAVVVEVLDEGPGFPAGVLENMFGRFVRGVEGDGRPPGVGLGLAVARGFVEAQGGAIEAGNRPDHVGAFVRITLPLG
jgi:two-component system sensor histidine kinase KdpD